MKTNDNDIFEVFLSLAALGIAAPFVGAGIYATILSLL